MTTAPRRWQGTGVLRVIPVQSTYQVLHFWDDDGAFSGWYVNFEAPKTRRDPGWIRSTGTWTCGPTLLGCEVEEEDEARAAVEAGQLPERDLELAWMTGKQMIEGLSDWRGVVGDWRSFALPPGGWRLACPATGRIEPGLGHNWTPKQALLP